jgi:hypothetical protein
MEAKRPKSVTSLAVGVLMLTGIQILRVWEAIRRWDFLESLSLSVPPVYFLLSGLVWTALGLLIAGGLWRGKPAAPRLLRWTSLAFTVYFWLDRMAIAASSLRRSGWGLTAVVMIFLLAVIFWVLSRPGTHRYFGEKNE